MLFEPELTAAQKARREMQQKRMTLAMAAGHAEAELLASHVVLQAWQLSGSPKQSPDDQNDFARFVCGLQGPDSDLAKWGLWLRDTKRTLDAARGQAPPCPPIPAFPVWFAWTEALYGLASRVHAKWGGAPLPDWAPPEVPLAPMAGVAADEPPAPNKPEAPARIITFDGIKFAEPNLASLSLAVSLATSAMQNGVQAGDLRWASPKEDFYVIAADDTKITMDAPTVISFALAVYRSR